MMKKFLFGGDRVLIDVYEGVKYEDKSEPKTITYEGVEGFEVVSGEAAAKIEAECDGSCIDEYHEYLVIYFKNGETSTFRNSHVDMFHI